MEPTEFVIYSEGLFFASVCSSLSKEEVESRMRVTLCGTRNGWNLSLQSFKSGESNPCPCDKQPDTHQHYLFEC